MTMCLTTYWIFRNRQGEDIYDKLLELSQFNFIFDVLKVMNMQGLIILVCYNWLLFSYSGCKALSCY